MTAFPTILYPLTFLVALAVERMFAARALPRVRFWLLRCLALFALAGAIQSLLGPLLARALAGHRVVALAEAPLLVGVAIGIVAADLALYAVHRALHVSAPLWRWVHRLHHSAERVDVAGSAYLHPFELATNIVLTSLVGAALGLSPLATAIVGYTAFALGTFQHTNIATPAWVGYLVQRPEGHSVHHARGVHAYNYGHLALWDAVFGTRRNPAAFAAEAGL